MLAYTDLQSSIAQAVLNYDIHTTHLQPSSSAEVRKKASSNNRMNPTPPSLPRSILIDDTSSLWYRQAIIKKAQAEIPDYYKSLPDLQALQFKHYVIKKENFRGNIGNYDEPTKDPKPPVCAFVHGGKKNKVGYFYPLDDITFVGFGPNHLGHVDFEEPSCDLGTDQHVRAMVLYYFLVAGYIEGMGDYSTFSGEFKRACGWIANGSIRSKLHPKMAGSDVGEHFATDEKFLPTLCKQ
jgi:hypothetical protein